MEPSGMGEKGPVRRQYVLKGSASAPSGSLTIPYEKELNPQQFAVVTAPGGPMLVLAGAGSGKTRVLVYRVAFLLESGVEPESILLVTFTNKAAREMLHRVEALLTAAVTDLTRSAGGEEARGAGRRLWGGTFHHVANLLLRKYGSILGYDPSFSILDAEDSKFLLQECVGELRIDPRAARFPKGDVLQDVVSFAVNSMRPMEEVVSERYPLFVNLAPEIIRVADLYERRKKKANLMDFDDLLVNWYRLIRESREVQDHLSRTFRHILVDEYQDTNRLQAMTVIELAKIHRNLLVVGDDAQSIYSFRGAEYKNILDFPELLSGVAIYKLEVNYRSTPEILNLANEVMRGGLRPAFPSTGGPVVSSQFYKELQAVNPSGPLPVLLPVQDPLQQSRFIAQHLLELRDEGISLSEMAVLYRAHYQSAELEMELMRRNIPYTMRSGLRFFEQAHIKDVLGYLRVILNPLDELSWRRILRLLEGIGRKTAQRIWEILAGRLVSGEVSVTESGAGESGFLASLKAPELLSLLRHRGGEALAETWKKLGEIFRILLQLSGRLSEPSGARQSAPSEMILRVLESGYDQYLFRTYRDARERAEDVRQLANFAAQYHDLEKFLSEITLQEGISGEEILLGDQEDEDKVVLSTIHRAKGLEWKVVFIPWLVEGHFPISRAYGNDEAMAEERRLFYVAVTRAKRHLFLVHPIVSVRAGFGNVIHRPSAFVAELPPSLYQQWDLVDMGSQGDGPVEACASPHLPGPVDCEGEDGLPRSSSVLERSTESGSKEVSEILTE